MQTFVPCCWVDQRRSQSAPWVLTTRLLLLPSIRAFLLPFFFMHIHWLSYYYFIQSFSVVHTQHTDAQCLIICASKTYPTMQLPSKNWSCNISQSIATGYVLLFSTEQTPTTYCSVHRYCSNVPHVDLEESARRHKHPSVLRRTMMTSTWPSSGSNQKNLSFAWGQTFVSAMDQRAMYLKNRYQLLQVYMECFSEWAVHGQEYAENTNKQWIAMLSLMSKRFQKTSWICFGILLNNPHES